MAKSSQRFTVTMPDGATVVAKNSIRVLGDVAFVKASDSEVEWSICTADVPVVAGIRWCVKNGKYACGNDGKKIVTMHRLLCPMPCESLEVDHVSRDAFDNRRSNLRAATRSGNASNMTPRKGTVSGYPCVVWDKSRDLWAVQTSVMISPGKHKACNFGRFKTLPEACLKSHAVLSSLGRFAPPIPFIVL